MAPVQARPGRRRQRSTRLTVAVLLLALAALAVAGALASGSWPLLAVAATLGVLLGAAATRITHNELTTARREAARDRAEQAQAYRRLTDERTAEQAVFATTMQRRIAYHQGVVLELEEALANAQQRATEATRKVNAEARRADAAERQARDAGERLEAGLSAAEDRASAASLRVAELEHELDVVRAELAAATVAWREAEAAQRRRA
jgi:hypothetical protein